MKRFAIAPVACAALLAAGLAAWPASADPINTFNDWSAFAETEGGQNVCYIGSTPKTQSGKYKNRGETYVLVTHRPADKTRGVVSVKGGYAYKKGAEVQINIDSERFTLFTDQDHAWAFDADGDRKLVAAMKAGSKMIVTGVSDKGTKTTDTYSLSGFTAAYNAIGRACPAK
ncbi:MAG: invasion associated locus B family protein [Rhodospirillales bacterium]